MHLSTSNSNDNNTGWWKLLVTGCALAIFMIHGFQAFLSLQGYSPWVSDSQALWGMHRERVKWITNPIVLAGGSRIQLDFNVEELGQLTKRKVVQLAIDGQGGMPVLEHFANDKSFKGTLIISLQESELLKKRTTSKRKRLSAWLENYKNRHKGTIAPNIEALLQAYFQIAYSYHSIEMDITSLMDRLISGVPGIIYLKTDINRDRFADYRKVPFPNFYVGRVIRHLGYTPQLPDSLTLKGFKQLIIEESKKIEPLKKDFLKQNIQHVRMLTEKIERDGNTVIIIRMPTDKLVLDIDNARSPHLQIWTEMRKIGIKSLHFSELPGIEKFHLPDGSHLDQSQKIAFTRIVAGTLIQRKWLP